TGLMKKNFIAAIAAVCAASLSTYPACADPASGQQSGKGSADGSSWPKKAIGFVVGAVVGTPICAFRRAIDEQKAATDYMVGNTDKKPLKVVVNVFWRSEEH